MIRGRARGAAFVCAKALAFMGDIDLDTGQVIARGHPHAGESIAGRVLIYPETKGSSGGCQVLTSLAKQKLQPAAIVLLKEPDTNLVEAAILAKVPMVCVPQPDLIERISHGLEVTVDGSTGQVHWLS